MRKKKQPLTADDFYFANDVTFLRSHPDIKRNLIEHERGRKPEDCTECFFFKWLFGEEKIISGGQCAANPDIAKDAFEYGGIPDGCPLEGDGKDEE